MKYISFFSYFKPFRKLNSYLLIIFPNRFTITLASLALVGVGLGCSLVTRLVTPAGPLVGGSEAGLIVIVGVDGNIYTYDSDGDSLQAITADANLSPAAGETGMVYLTPVWAPDGEHLAFVGVSADSQVSRTARILTLDLASGEVQESFSSQEYFPFYLFWSPDSQQITFLSNDPAGNGLALLMAPAASGESRRLDMGQPYYWDWTPDGSEIIVHTGGSAEFNSGAGIGRLAISSPAEKVAIDLQPGAFQAPAWSPDGSSIALVVHADHGDELVLVDRDGVVLHQVTELAGPTFFAWSPDGRQLAYAVPSSASPDEVNLDLTLFDPQSGRARVLEQAFVVGFFWSPDSSRLVYFTPRLGDSGGDALYLPQTQPLLQLSLNIVDVESAEMAQITTFTPTVSFLSLLPFYDQYQRSATIWSPDSKSLVLTGIDAQSQAGVYVVDLDARTSTLIAPGDLAFWSPK